MRRRKEIALADERDVWTLAAALMLAGCGERPDSPVTAAAAAGRTGEVRRLAAAGADVNAVDGQGSTPLISAARRGQVATLKALLDLGAAVDRRDGRGNHWTPLVHAIHKRQNAAARALLEAGAQVDANQGGGTTPLMYAAAYGNTEVVRELLRRGADPYAKAAGGVTALSNAIGGGALFDITDGPRLGTCHLETVKALLQKAPALRLPGGFWSRVSRWVSRSPACDEARRLAGGV